MKMEQITARLLAEMKTNQGQMKAQVSSLASWMDVYQAKIEVNNMKVGVLGENVDQSRNEKLNRHSHLPHGYPPRQDRVHPRINESHDEHTSREDGGPS
jgi:3'-phosphoadenosine 5'-phosphosulfate sulfotransferase